MRTPSRTRSTLARVLMGVVALSGALVLVGLRWPEVGLYDDWSSDTWVLVALAGAVCAGAAVALGRRGDGGVALVAAIVTTACSALVAADDDAQGPFLEVPVLLGSVLVLAAGAWGVWAIGVERSAPRG